jgi:pimeloyl-ACP methyl ester carboxylesterase
VRRAVGVASVVAAGAGAVAAWRADRRWRAADDPCDNAPLAEPDGDGFEVQTDDGATLSALVAGDGPTVVLSHCWTGSRGVWGPVARRLVDRGLRVVLYDQRGHGGSTVGKEGCTIERLGADLRDVLGTVDARDAVVAGHSMGGMSVQSLAAHHPDDTRDRVRALVLVSTAAAGLGAARVAATAAAAAVASPLTERLLRAQFGHALVRNSVGRRAVYSHLAATRDTFVETPGEVRRDFLEAMQSMDLRPKLARVEAPATVVVGTRDRLTPPKLGRDLVRTLPTARLVEIPDAGHMLPFEQPDRVADLITEASGRS